MYNKILLLFLFIFFVSGCSTKIYNIPFINADEAIHLEFGMSQSEVLKKLNEPLYVSYGDKDEIVWVYEVRTIEVKSKVLIDNTTIIPVKKAKNPNDERHALPINKLFVTFTKGNLTSWRTNDE